MKGLFLEKPGLLKEALKNEEQWKRQVPGYNSTLARIQSPMTSLELSLNKLNAYRELGEWTQQFLDPDAEARCQHHLDDSPLCQTYSSRVNDAR